MALDNHESDGQSMPPINYEYVVPGMGVVSSGEIRSDNVNGPIDLRRVLTEVKIIDALIKNGDSGSGKTSVGYSEKYAEGYAGIDWGKGKPENN